MGWWMLVVSLSIAAQSNNIKFQKVQLEVNAIPYNSIAAITQDKEGYLWISTNEGVIRYNSYESKIYQHNPIDSTSIGDDVIEALYVDEMTENIYILLVQNSVKNLNYFHTQKIFYDSSNIAENHHNLLGYVPICLSNASPNDYRKSDRCSG